MNPDENPFTHDADRHEIWNMIVRRNVEAFLEADWTKVAEDFDRTRFQGVHANRRSQPDEWTLAFPTLDAYKSEWLRLADEITTLSYREPMMPAILRATDLSRIEIYGDVALALKNYSGGIKRTDGGTYDLDWQTKYFCRKASCGWKVVGFVGYMKSH